MDEQENMEDLELAKHATVPGLIKYTFFPIMTMLLSSLYMVGDGVFISNLTSSTEYAGTVMAEPYVTCFSAIGFMIGGGGNAFVGKLLGEGKRKGAVNAFSMLVEFAVVVTVVISLIGVLFLKPFLMLQGAHGQLLEEAFQYGLVLFCGTVFLALQYVFQLFLITSGDEVRAFLYTLFAGAVNIGFDSLFMLVLRMGNGGAALGTVLGEFVGAVVPFIFYVKSRKREGAVLYFKWTGIEPKTVGAVCFNGASEMVETISESVLGVLYNYQLLRLVGENGLASYGSIMYVFLIFNLSFVGYNEAVVPMIAYQYGAENKKELKNLIKKSITIISCLSLVFFGITEIFAELLSDVFAVEGTEVYYMSISGFRICGIALLFMGCAMFIPSIYTAVNNGLVSALLTLMEVLIFPAVLVSILPAIWGITGVWRAEYFAWALSLIVSVICVKCVGIDK